jgi:hypothetical protein
VQVAQTSFYLLDVGTSNALVLYNKSVKIRLQQPAQHTPMNILQFKMKLVEDLVGRSIDNLFKRRGGGGEQYTPVHIEGGVQSQCAYCALMSINCAEQDINARIVVFHCV